MKKEILKVIVIIMLWIGFITIISLAFNECNKEFFKEVNKLESRIGTKVIINKDTLLIIDCSILNNSYTLEDGREISYKLIEKLENEKKDN
jgi:hypothetical protein